MSRLELSTAVPSQADRDQFALENAEWRDVQNMDFLERNQYTARTIARSRSLTPEMKRLKAKYGTFGRVYDLVRVAQGR